MNDILFYSIALLVAGYVFWIWLGDLRNHSSEMTQGDVGGSVAGEKRRPPTFPGATPVGALAIAVAVVGALVLLGVEVGGEYGLGIVGEQTDMTVLFGLYTLAAAFVEELIFRGYLVYERGTKAQLILGIVFISAVFAAVHPYMWQWQTPEGASSWEFWRGTLTPKFDKKAVFSTAIVFVRSLWFYCVRFCPMNPLRSLLPSVAAHLATNIGVFVLKAAQGHVTGLY
jgi:membrane protease YdiL (CAAX protease family)